MSERQLDCAAFRALLDRYFDEAFPDRIALDAHAASCADCRAVFATATDELADLPCREFVELVTEYLDHATSPRDGARIDRHLELCEGCRAYLRQIRLAIELAAGAPVDPPDVHVRDALVAAYRALRRRA